MIVSNQIFSTYQWFQRCWKSSMLNRFLFRHDPGCSTSYLGRWQKHWGIRPIHHGAYVTKQCIWYVLRDSQVLSGSTGTPQYKACRITFFFLFILLLIASLHSNLHRESLKLHPGGAHGFRASCVSPSETSLSGSVHGCSHASRYLLYQCAL